MEISSTMVVQELIRYWNEFSTREKARMICCITPSVIVPMYTPRRRRLERVSREDPVIRTLLQVPGIGVLTATAMYASVANVHANRRLRKMGSFERVHDRGEQWNELQLLVQRRNQLLARVAGDDHHAGLGEDLLQPVGPFDRDDLRLDADVAQLRCDDLPAVAGVADLHGIGALPSDHARLRGEREDEHAAEGAHVLGTELDGGHHRGPHGTARDDPVAGDEYHAIQVREDSLAQ